MIDRNYLARHAVTLLKLANATTDRVLAAALIAKAADLQIRIDELSDHDLTSSATDIEPSAKADDHRSAC